MNFSEHMGEREVGRLESYISETMRYNRVFGLSICIVRDGKVIYSRGFGLRSADPPKPATVDTLYGIGSSTKVFTALSILKLVDEYKIYLNDPVNKYIKGLRFDSKNPPITIHQLLSHTSGYPDLGVALGTLGVPMGEQDMWSPLGSIDDLVTLINDASAERISANGDVFMYWNEGYVLLGRVIEEVSGEKYPDFVTKNILRPLEMKRSTFDVSKLESDEDGMMGYYSAHDGKKVAHKFPFHPLGYADGGLISSASELSNLISMLLDGGSFRGKRVVSSESLKIALTPQIRINFPVSKGGRISYGYGVVIDDDFFGQTKIGHGGNVTISSAYFGFIPALRVGVALASNSDFYVGSIGDYALSLAMGMDPEKIPRVAFEKMVETLEGRYETYKGATKMRICRKGPSLVMEIGNEEQHSDIPLLIEGKSVFALMGPARSRLYTKIRSNYEVDIGFDRFIFHKVGKL